MSSAMVVLSGGQDSTTCLFWAKQYYETVHAVCFDYGQRHRIEIESAEIIADRADIASFEVISLLEDVLESTSPLTSKQVTLEQYANHAAMEAIIGDRIEKTFVPMRNMLFLTLAANRAIARGCETLVTGICQEDNANYPDCREEFRQSMEMAIFYALDRPLMIKAPLMYKSKAESVKLALQIPGAYAALAWSHTSYDGKYPPTDMNHSNVLRAHGFAVAQVPDPLVLRAFSEGKMDLPDTSNYSLERIQAVVHKLDDLREDVVAAVAAHWGVR